MFVSILSIIFHTCNLYDIFQRYESVLENLQWGDDWHVMCATTPGRVQGRNFDGPTSCASWVSLQIIEVFFWFLHDLFNIRMFIREVASMLYGWLRTKTATSQSS